VVISSSPHSSSSFSHPEKLEAGCGLEIGGGKLDSDVRELGAGAAYYFMFNWLLRCKGY